MDSTVVILLLLLLSAGSWKVTQPVTNRDTTERQTDRLSVCVGGVQMGIQIGINTI